MKLETWRNLLKNIPDDDVSSLRDMSQMWNSCAVGEKLGFPCSTRHQMETLLCDHDNKLYELGSEFHNSIKNNNKSEAMTILRKIEKHKVDRKVIKGVGEPLN